MISTGVVEPRVTPCRKAFVFCGDDEDGVEAEQPGPDRIPFAGGEIRRLLVVEDDWFIGMELETVLREAGYEVVDVVPSAEEAVAAAVRQRPDLILMDIRLAGKRDGIEAAIEIRDRADISCIFVSAHQDEASRARAARARPAGWVAKPFSHAQIVAAIEAAGRNQ